MRREVCEHGNLVEGGLCKECMAEAPKGKWLTQAQWEAVTLLLTTLPLHAWGPSTSVGRALRAIEVSGLEVLQ